MVYASAFICLLISVGIHCEVSDSASDVQKVSLDDVLKPIRITDDKLGYYVNESTIPTVKQGTETLQKMCTQNGGNDSFNRANDALNKVQNCFDEIIKFAELPGRVEKAKPNGELDTVFKDYCKRTDDLKGCIVKFLADVEPCLAENQKSSKYTIQNITASILHFACEYEGDHIALFISERGPECFIDRQIGIQECIRSRINDTKTNETFDQWLNQTNTDSLTGVGNVSEEPLSLDFELDQCKRYYDIRKCIIRELGHCSSSTAANVLETVFNLVQSSTTCSKYSQKDLDPEYNGAILSASRSLFSVIIPALTILMVRYLS